MSGESSEGSHVPAVDTDTESAESADSPPLPHARKKYGWKRDKVMNGGGGAMLHRIYRAPLVSSLPTSWSLYSDMPPAVQQGALNSCTACATLAALEYCKRTADLPRSQSPPGSTGLPTGLAELAGTAASASAVGFGPFSPLFLYYNSRLLDGNGAQSEDNGASLYNCLESVRTNGVCAEVFWPYDPTRFATRPPDLAYLDARSRLTGVLQFERVNQDKWSVEACIYNKRPVIFGIVAYESIEDPAVEQTGEIPLPKEDEIPLGGHALLLFSYDSALKRFGVLNSWGPEWGSRKMPGTGTIPYAYVLNTERAADLWTCRFLPMPPIDMQPTGLKPISSVTGVELPSTAVRSAISSINDTLNTLSISAALAASTTVSSTAATTAAAGCQS